jgi:hypothetical protein
MEKLFSSPDLQGNTVAVVIPAYKVQDQFLGVLSGIPQWVDCFIVVDDANQHNSSAILKIGYLPNTFGTAIQDA